MDAKWALARTMLGIGLAGCGASRPGATPADEGRTVVFDSSGPPMTFRDDGPWTWRVGSAEPDDAGLRQALAAYREWLAAERGSSPEELVTLHAVRAPFLTGDRWIHAAASAAGGHIDLGGAWVRLRDGEARVIDVDVESIDKQGYYQRLRGVWACGPEYAGQMHEALEKGLLVDPADVRARNCTYAFPDLVTSAASFPRSPDIDHAALWRDLALFTTAVANEAPLGTFTLEVPPGLRFEEGADRTPRAVEVTFQGPNVSVMGWVATDDRLLQELDLRFARQPTPTLAVKVRSLGRTVGNVE